MILSIRKRWFRLNGEREKYLEDKIVYPSSRFYRAKKNNSSNKWTRVRSLDIFGVNNNFYLLLV